jgi:hypothetical protein
MKRLSLALIAAAALTGTGCSSIFHRPHFVQIRPVTTPTASQASRQADAHSPYYQSAVRAIGARDYALALDLLQAARSQTPNDPAVINGFGVVYDKLGRFDLSTRYYTQAAALDPDSPIVRQNLAYSAMLQERSTPTPLPGAAPVTRLAAAETSPAPSIAAVSAALLASSPPATVPQSRPAAVAPQSPALLGGPPTPKTSTITVAQAPGVQVKPTITIAKPAAPIMVAVAPNGVLLTGRSLQIYDASGSNSGAEGVRTQLASRGWSAPKSAVTLAKVEAKTRIVYPQGGQAVAQALARTLPFPVEVAACDDRCTSVSLIVGQDAAGHLRAHS